MNVIIDNKFQSVSMSAALVRSMLMFPQDFSRWPDEPFEEMDSTLAVQQYIQQMIRREPENIDWILSMPDAQDEGVWKYEHLRQFCMELNGLAVRLQEECNPGTCTQMTATEQWIFLCAAHKTPKECPAIDYTRHTLDGAACLLNSNKYFPSRYFCMKLFLYSIHILFLYWYLYSLMLLVILVLTMLFIVSESASESPPLRNWDRSVAESTEFSRTRTFTIGQYSMSLRMKRSSAAGLLSFTLVQWSILILSAGPSALKISNR